MNANRCSHPGCSCAAEAQQRYCSDACQRASEGRNRFAKCGCGHESCRENARDLLALA